MLWRIVYRDLKECCCLASVSAGLIQLQGPLCRRGPLGPELSLAGCCAQTSPPMWHALTDHECLTDLCCSSVPAMLLSALRGQRPYLTFLKVTVHIQDHLNPGHLLESGTSHGAAGLWALALSTSPPHQSTHSAAPGQTPMVPAVAQH